MSDDALEWDDAKAAEIWRRHGVSFQQDAKALRDPFAVEWIDDRENYGEERINVLGMCDGVYHPHRAWRTDMDHLGQKEPQDASKTTTIAKMRPDGSVVEVLADGGERPLPTLRCGQWRRKR